MQRGRRSKSWSAALFYSKYQDSIQFVSPVSGKVKEIRRGAKRKVLEIVISADQKQQSVQHKLPSLGKITPEQIKEQLLASGNWPFIKQLPLRYRCQSQRYAKGDFCQRCGNRSFVCSVRCGFGRTTGCVSIGNGYVVKTLAKFAFEYRS